MTVLPTDAVMEIVDLTDIPGCGAGDNRRAGPIIGARIAAHDFLHDAMSDWLKERPIVTLCACPEDACTIQAARQLLNQGYLSVKPLRGGYEAWLAATRQPSAGTVKG